jgi:hypothetical protein
VVKKRVEYGWWRKEWSGEEKDGVVKKRMEW